ncbi:MAG: DMT family protein [Novosphingobium meiothermophilum]|uniref:DMT family protein n=1 Tax=Novosphingobium TaxID=165696 RepID=UPI000D6E963A|nr:MULTISPECIES: DMT family protein [Novosphingobium]
MFPALPSAFPVVGLLVVSNLFMTVAWYWHIRGDAAEIAARPLVWVILTSWGIALFEYCLAVPANRLGALHGWSAGQLKITQEAIALTVFGVFMVLFLKEPLHWRHLAAFGCIMAAVFFLFSGK